MPTSVTSWVVFYHRARCGLLYSQRAKSFVGDTGSLPSTPTSLYQNCPISTVETGLGRRIGLDPLDSSSGSAGSFPSKAAKLSLLNIA
jgi:hypothetical protein